LRELLPGERMGSKQSRTSLTWGSRGMLRRLGGGEQTLSHRRRPEGLASLRVGSWEMKSWSLRARTSRGEVGKEATGFAVEDTGSP
jgi:hypothetical protein